MTHTIRSLSISVFVNGQDANVEEVHTTHDVDQPIATGSITFRKPWPVLTELGAQVEMYAGWDGDVRRIFWGRLAEETGTYDAGGGLLKMELEGWGKYLFFVEQQNLVVPGPRTLQHVFYALCNHRAPFLYHSDLTYAPNGSTLSLGGNPYVDGGNIVIKKDTSPGERLVRLAKLFGYRVFDRNDGYLMQQRVSGLPDAGKVWRTYREGENVLSIGQTRTLDGMANYVEVRGANYKGAADQEFALRGIPATVTADPRFGPSGVNKLPINDADLVTETLVSHARQTAELDYNAPQYRWRWSTTGDPEVMPGQVVALESVTVGGYTPLWLMRVQHSITNNGWTTSMEGWAGTGTALPAGDDCTVRTLIGGQGVHIGNETLNHYRNPSPISTSHKVTFTLPDDYSTLTVRGLGHGANSFQFNAESTASRFECWQTVNGEYKSVASGEMPRMPENLEKRYPYGPTNTYWQDFVIPLSGSLIAGTVDFLIIAGKDTTVGDIDDYEVCNVTLETCGVGTPVILG